MVGRNNPINRGCHTDVPAGMTPSGFKAKQNNIRKKIPLFPNFRLPPVASLEIKAKIDHACDGTKSIYTNETSHLLSCNDTIYTSTFCLNVLLLPPTFYLWSGKNISLQRGCQHTRIIMINSQVLVCFGFSSFPFFSLIKALSVPQVRNGQGPMTEVACLSHVVILLRVQVLRTSIAYGLPISESAF